MVKGRALNQGSQRNSEGECSIEQDALQPETSRLGFSNGDQCFCAIEQCLNDQQEYQGFKEPAKEVVNGNAKVRSLGSTLSLL